MKEIKTECPCCKSQLVIDAKTGAVLQHKEHKEPTQSLEDFLKTEQARNEDLAARFAASADREKAKKDLLNKKFEWAKKNKDKLPDAPKPNIFWD